MSQTEVINKFNFNKGTASRIASKLEYCLNLTAEDMGKNKKRCLKYQDIEEFALNFINKMRES